MMPTYTQETGTQTLSVSTTSTMSQSVSSRTSPTRYAVVSTIGRSTKTSAPTPSTLITASQSPTATIPERPYDEPDPI